MSVGTGAVRIRVEKEWRVGGYGQRLEKVGLNGDFGERGPRSSKVRLFASL